LRLGSYVRPDQTSSDKLGKTAWQAVEKLLKAGE